MEEARLERRRALEEIRLERFKSFKHSVESLALNSGDLITLKLKKAGYDDRGPDFVDAEIMALYKRFDPEKRGVHVELVGPTGRFSGGETFFPFDEYEEISIVRSV